jgi:hypothetical protein
MTSLYTYLLQLLGLRARIEVKVLLLALKSCSGYGDDKIEKVGSQEMMNYRLLQRHTPFSTATHLQDV